jgi:hypothetical protein
MKLDDIVEISDPDIDVEEIMDCIRQRLETRQKQAEALGQDYSHLPDEAGGPSAGVGPAELYGQLHQLGQSTDGLRVSPVVTDWHVPLLNGPINRAKNQLHILVLMYVNTLAGRQIAVNRLTYQACLSLANLNQANQVRIEALEQQVADLRERLERGANSH